MNTDRREEALKGNEFDCDRKYMDSWVKSENQLMPLLSLHLRIDGRKFFFRNWCPIYVHNKRNRFVGDI